MEQGSRGLFEAEEQVRALAKQRRAGEPQAAAALEARSPGWIRIPRAGSPGLSRSTLTWSTPPRTTTAWWRCAGEALAKSPAGRCTIRLRKRWPAQGARADQPNRCRQLVDSLSIELVLTAHPTEARRRTTALQVEPHRGSPAGAGRLRCAAAGRNRGAAGAARRDHRLWLTDRARSAKPAVTDEVRTTLYFVGQIFWTAMPRIHELPAKPPWTAIFPAWTPRAPGCAWPPGSAATATATPTSPPR